PTDSTDKNVFYIAHSNSPNKGATAGINDDVKTNPSCVDFCNFKNRFPTHGIGNPSYGWMNVAKPEAHLIVPVVCEGNSVPADARGSLNDTRYKFLYCLYDTAANACKEPYTELMASRTDTMPCLDEIIDIFSFESQYFDTGNFYSIKLKIYNDCGHWDTTNEVFEYLPRPRAIATGPDTICSGINQITVDGSQSFGDYDSAQWQVYKEDQMLLKDTFGNEMDTFRVMHDTIYQPDTSLIDTIKIDTVEISGLPANDSTIINKFKRYINYFEEGNVTDTMIHSSNIDSITFPNFEFKANQKYKVKLTLFGYCGPAGDTHSVYVHPVEIEAGPDKIIHAPGLNGNDTVTLEGAGEGGNDYSWSPKSGLTSPDTLETEVIQDNTIDYVLSATNDFGCNVSDTATVYYNTLAYAGPDRAICLGDTIGLGTNPDPNYNYRWSTGRGLSDSTIANPMAFPDTSIKYTMFAMDTNNDTIEFDHVQVSIDDQLDPFVINDSAKTSTVGDPLELEPTSSHKFSNYQWFHNGDTLKGKTGPSYIPEENGEYFLMADWICGNDTIQVRSNFVWVEDEECEEEGENYPEGKVFREDKHIESQEIYFGDDVIIKPGVEVQIENSEVYMAPCTRIIVETNEEDGGILELGGTYIQSCGKWKGIYVEGIPKSVTTQTSPHGNLYLDGDPGTKSVIQDALVGVYINHGAKFQAKDYKFSNNHIHVAIRNGNYEFTQYGNFSHYPYIQNCEFGYTLKGMPNYQPYCEGCEEYCFEAFRDPPLSKMIYIEETRFFEIENNKFSETSIGKNRTAISGYDAGFAKIYNNIIEGGLKYGYYFESLSNSMILNDSFEASSTTKNAGVYLEYSDSININDVS
ncbi:MAG: hypothetical protein BRD49_04385, partial [Bacteroidetes bacterium SW_10_40_5]